MCQTFYGLLRQEPDASKKKLYFYTLTASKHQKQSEARIDKNSTLTFRSAAVYEQSTKQK